LVEEEVAEGTAQVEMVGTVTGLQVEETAQQALAPQQLLEQLILAVEEEAGLMQLLPLLVVQVMHELRIGVNHG
jgi:hypothetical protein